MKDIFEMFLITSFYLVKNVLFGVFRGTIIDNSRRFFYVVFCVNYFFEDILEGFYCIKSGHRTSVH